MTRVVLDTDHLTELQLGSDAGVRPDSRLSRPDEQLQVATTIVGVEEQLRGRLAVIGRAKGASRSVVAYEGLFRLIAFCKYWRIPPFDLRAAAVHESLPTKTIQRVGSMDGKIASIVLANGARLLSRNLRDFRQVPGLIVEEWVEQKGPGTTST